MSKSVGRKGSEGVEGVEYAKGYPLPSGVGYAEGVSPHSRKFLNFAFEMACTVHPVRHFCQEMLAGYSDYNTMFAG